MCPHCMIPTNIMILINLLFCLNSYQTLTVFFQIYCINIILNLKPPG